MLIDFATEFKLKIISTHFQRKDIYKATWMAPKGKTMNQIDHVLIEEHHAKMIKNVRSQRGAAINSDHFLVRINFKQDFPTVQRKTGKGPDRFNTKMLCNKEVILEYQKELKGKLEETHDVRDVESKWESFEKAMASIARKNLKRTVKIAGKIWFDAECKKGWRQRTNYVQFIFRTKQKRVRENSKKKEEK